MYTITRAHPFQNFYYYSINIYYSHVTLRLNKPLFLKKCNSSSSLLHRVPERGSLGLRFFSSSSALSQRRTMKSTLILITKNLQNEIDQLLRPAAGETETEGDRAETQEKMALIQNCLKCVFCTIITTGCFTMYMYIYMCVYIVS